MEQKRGEAGGQAGSRSRCLKNTNKIHMEERLLAAATLTGLFVVSFQKKNVQYVLVILSYLYISMDKKTK